MKWIRVDDELPKDNKKCWISAISKEGKRVEGVAAYSHKYEKFICGNCAFYGQFYSFFFDGMKITHWQEIVYPEAPNEG